MKTLENLALKAVPHPAEMARKYLPPHHPLAVALKAIDYEQQRNKFRQEDRHRFRYVLKEFWFLENFFATFDLRPTHVAFVHKHIIVR